MIGEIVGRYATRGLAGLSIVGGVALGLHNNSTPPEAHVSNYGKGTITELTLEPGTYCDVKAVVNIKDVAATYSWEPTLINPHITIPFTDIKPKLSSPVHATIKQWMSGPIEAQLCIKTRSLQTVEEDSNGDFTFTLKATDNKDTSDFTLTEFPQNLQNMNYHNDGGNWVSRLNDATFGNLRNNLNTMPWFNIQGNENIFKVLSDIDLLQAYNNVALMCGPQIVDRVTASNIPGGNAQEQMIKEIFSSVPKQYKVPDVSKIRWNIINDGTGLPDQYTDVPYRVRGASKNIQLPTQKQMEQKGADCTDIVKQVGHVAVTQKPGGAPTTATSTALPSAVKPKGSR